MSENSDVMPIPDAREHVRRRPGMYFGGVDSKALHQLVFELVENSIGQVTRIHSKPDVTAVLPLLRVTTSKSMTSR